MDHDCISDLGSYDGSEVPHPLRRFLLLRVRIIRVLFVQGLRSSREENEIEQD